MRNSPLSELVRTSSAEGAVASLPEDVNHRLEGEPLGDVLARPQAAAELGAAEFDHLLSVLLGPALLHVALLWADVYHVLVVGDSNAKLRLVLLAHLLRIVGAIEVVARDGALGSCHVAADDEVSGTEVLADDHVLDR